MSQLFKGFINCCPFIRGLKNKYRTIFEYYSNAKYRKPWFINSPACFNRPGSLCGGNYYRRDNLFIRFAIYNFSGFRGLLIIHFDSFRGIDFLGDKGDVFKILGLGIIVLVINAVLAHEFYWKERFLSYVLSFGTAIFSLLILMAIIAIISIN